MNVSPAPLSTTAATSVDFVAASMPSATPWITASVRVFFFSGRFSVMTAMSSRSSYSTGSASLMEPASHGPIPRHLLGPPPTAPSPVDPGHPTTTTPTPTRVRAKPNPWDTRTSSPNTRRPRATLTAGNIAPVTAAGSGSACTART